MQKDDMEQIKQDILSADMVVFVTPLYYYRMSAQLKILIDRSHSIRNNKKIGQRTDWLSGGIDVIFVQFSLSPYISYRIKLQRVLLQSLFSNKNKPIFYKLT